MNVNLSRGSLYFDERVVFAGRVALDGIDARVTPNVCSSSAI
jgi:hypothetical protein